MGVGEVLSAIGGGLKGGLDAYSWQSEQDLSRKKLQQQDEISRLTNEIRLMIAQANGASRENVAGVGAKSRENVANINAGSRENVANITSKSREGIAAHQTDYLYDKLFTDDSRQREEEQGRNDRWGTASGNARLGSQTTRRGQDITAGTAQRGQDITAETARRGQDTSATNTRYRADHRPKNMYEGVFDTPVTPVTSPTVPPAAAPAGTTPVTPLATAAAAPATSSVDPSDADLETLATSILTSQGIPATPENIRTFVTRNRQGLAQEIVRVRGGGR